MVLAPSLDQSEPIPSWPRAIFQFTPSNGGKKRKKKEKKSGKIMKIVAYGCFDETVCTAPLGPKHQKRQNIECVAMPDTLLSISTCC